MMEEKKKMPTTEELFGVTITVDPSLDKLQLKPSSTLKIINEWLSMPGNFEEVFGFKPTKRNA